MEALVRTARAFTKTDGFAVGTTKTTAATRRPQSGKAAAQAERDRSPVAAATREPGRSKFPPPPRVRGRCGRGPPARRYSRGPARLLPLRWHQSDRWKIVAEAGHLVPEGRRRRLAGGKPATAGAAPGCQAEWGMPQRGIGEGLFVARPALSSPPRALSDRSGRHPASFLRCPAGARNHSARFPGAASAGADLPPANLLRCPSGTGSGRSRTGQGNPPSRELHSQLGRLRLRSSELDWLENFACREAFGTRAVPARSGCALTTTPETPGAPAPMWPLRPGTGPAPPGLRLHRSAHIFSLWFIGII